MRAFTCLAFFLWMGSACKTLSREPSSEVKTALIYSPIDRSEIKDLEFQFCPDTRAFSAPNALWLDYFASIPYANYEVVGTELAHLPFGNPGEAREIQKNAMIHRSKRIGEKKKSAEDSWKSEAERLAARTALSEKYRLLFNEDIPADSQTADEFERNVLESTSGKIVFLNSSTEDGYLGKPSTQAILVESASEDFAILSFRGTEFDEIADVIADASLLQKDFLGLGNVHRGFLFSYHEISKKIVDALKAKSKGRKLKLWVTGHSLGGAISTIFVADFLKRQENGEFSGITLAGSYVYGSPRVGDRTFAKSFDSLLVGQGSMFVRVRNHRDPVTMLPIGIWGVGSYQHVGAFAYIDGEGKMHLSKGNSIDLTDFNKNEMPDLNDHLLAGYWNGVRDFYKNNAEGRLGACASDSAADVPPEFYWEFKDSDQKSTGKKK